MRRKTSVEDMCACECLISVPTQCMQCTMSSVGPRPNVMLDPTFGATNIDFTHRISIWKIAVGRRVAIEIKKFLRANGQTFSVR